MAITLPSSRSVALYTRPMPPSPSKSSIRNRGPNSSPGSKTLERAPEALGLRLCDGECPLGVRTIDAALVLESCGEGCVAVGLLGFAGASIVRSSAKLGSGARHSMQRTAESGFSRPQEGHFMIEGDSVRCRNSNYPVPNRCLQAISPLGANPLGRCFAALLIGADRPAMRSIIVSNGPK